MKVGDLVVLSARGSQLKRNWREIGAIGIVMEVIQYYSHYDYKVRWTTTKGGLRSHNSFLKRYEIKYMKVDKKCP